MIEIFSLRPAKNRIMNIYQHTKSTHVVCDVYVVKCISSRRRCQTGALESEREKKMIFEEMRYLIAFPHNQITHRTDYCEKCACGCQRT